MAPSSRRFRFLRRTAIVLGAGSVLLGALLAIGVGVINYRGERAWAAYKAEREAQGLTIQSLQPAAPVADEENFAKTPLFATQDWEALKKHLELKPKEEKASHPARGGWSSAQPVDLPAWASYLGVADLHDYLKHYEAELAEIRMAAKRPQAFFNIDLTKGVTAPMEHLSPLIFLANLYQLDALAWLQEGKTDAAAEDMLTLFRLARHSAQPHLLVQQLIEISTLGVALQPLWEGLERHQWDDGSLQQFAEALESFDLLTEWVKAVDGEQILGLHSFEQIASGWPDPSAPRKWVFDASLLGRSTKAILRGWVYQSVVSDGAFLSRFTEQAVDLKRHSIAPRLAESLINDRSHAIRNRLSTASLLISSSTVAGTLKRVAYTQTSLNQAIIACALERYRLAHGNYPEALAALVPEYCKALPHDLITGEPLIYLRDEQGGYKLYSVGWNQKDDGGRLEPETKKPQLRADWVWQIR